ncbi:MAG: ATP-binding protein [Acidimicrobiales bacterium]
MTPPADRPRLPPLTPRRQPNGDRVLELQIPPQRDYLVLARELVAAANQDAGLDPLRLDNLQLAVSEACTNAIEAHESRGVQHPIAIRAAVSDVGVEVVISDRGGGFDPAGAVTLPEPEDPRRLEFEHGLGLGLMRALSDRLEIHSSPAGTAVRVVMLSAPAASGVPGGTPGTAPGP